MCFHVKLSWSCRGQTYNLSVTEQQLQHFCSCCQKQITTDLWVYDLQVKQVLWDFLVWEDHLDLLGISVHQVPKHCTIMVDHIISYDISIVVVVYWMSKGLYIVFIWLHTLTYFLFSRSSWDSRTPRYESIFQNKRVLLSLKVFFFVLFKYLYSDLLSQVLLEFQDSLVLKVMPHSLKKQKVKNVHIATHCHREGRLQKLNEGRIKHLKSHHVGTDYTTTHLYMWELYQNNWPFYCQSSPS